MPFGPLGQPLQPVVRPAGQFLDQPESAQQVVVGLAGGFGHLGGVGGSWRAPQWSRPTLRRRAHSGGACSRCGAPRQSQQDHGTRTGPGTSAAPPGGPPGAMPRYPGRPDSTVGATCSASEKGERAPRAASMPCFARSASATEGSAPRLSESVIGRRRTARIRPAPACMSAVTRRPRRPAEDEPARRPVVVDHAPHRIPNGRDPLPLVDQHRTRQRPASRFRVVGHHLGRRWMVQPERRRRQPLRGAGLACSADALDEAGRMDFQQPRQPPVDVPPQVFHA